jgi:hypothetical protein
MKEYLPIEQEKVLVLLNNFLTSNILTQGGDNELTMLNSLTITERYMLSMLKIHNAGKIIDIMLFKRRFKSQCLGCKTKIDKLKAACDDLR